MFEDAENESKFQISFGHKKQSDLIKIIQQWQVQNCKQDGIYHCNSPVPSYMSYFEYLGLYILQN